MGLRSLRSRVLESIRAIDGRLFLDTLIFEQLSVAKINETFREKN